MNFLSVCSGVEAASVAWKDLKYKAVGFSEIDAFPSRVLQHHYPKIPNFGDMTQFKDWKINEPVELLVGGTPCQSFSVAGLRKGLADPRGNLMLTYLSIAAKYRPRWLVWENVPGVLSSNKGRDFGTFLGALGKIGYGFAYRVLDAQYFGVPQRRRRVFVVGYLGHWTRSAAVLFERESLSGHTPQSKEKRKDTSKSTGKSIVYENHATDSRITNVGELAPTITSRYGTGGNNVPLVQNKSAVRRLTPEECELLQGFPKGYTDIKPKGKRTPDAPRYKAMGNSMAVPVMKWIGERIKMVEGLMK